MNDLPFTGERFVPGAKGEIWIEHWHRYHFATRWAAGKVVLDVACGEGYGSALLARHARHVTGVDISAAAIAHARHAYADVGNVEYRVGSCMRLPIADGCIDLAVSFETVEHIDGQREFVDELARVLKPSGVLLLSCPNKLEYSDRRGFANEFHVKELYREELEALVARNFPAREWFGQRPTFFSVIAPERAAARAQAQVLEVSEAEPAKAAPTLSSPLYFILAASREAGALGEVPPALSVLADADDWVRRDYEKVMRWLTETDARARTLDRQLAERGAAAEALEKQVRGLEAAISLQEAALSAQRALAQAADAAHAAELAAKEGEIARRRGWRWWLRLPLVRLGLLK